MTTRSILLSHPTPAVDHGRGVVRAVHADWLLDPDLLAGTRAPRTLATYREHLAEYVAFAGSAAAALDPATLARWRQHLYTSGYQTPAGDTHAYSVNSINLRLAAVRGVIREAAEQGHVDPALAVHFAGVRGLRPAANPTRRRRHARTYISPEQMRQLVETPDTTTPPGLMHRALLLTLGTGGLRISEAVNLTITDLQLFQMRSGKTGWAVWVAGKNQFEPSPRPLSGEAKIAIDAWLACRATLNVTSDFIFTSFGGRGGRAPSAAPISRQSAWQMVVRYARRIGLEHVKPHDLRRFVGTQLARRDIRLAQKQLGHKRLETTAQHYVLDEPEVGQTDDLF